MIRRLVLFVSGLICCVPAPAFAQTSVIPAVYAASSGPTPSGIDWTSVINTTIQVALVPTLIAVLVFLVRSIGPGIAWLESHTAIRKHEAANAVKNRFLDLIAQGVRAELQTTVDAIKSDNAAGKLTMSQYREALADVKTKVIAQAKGQADREKILGDVSVVLGGNVDDFAAQAVEAFLHQSQGASTQAVKALNSIASVAMASVTGPGVVDPTAAPVTPSAAAVPASAPTT